MANRTPTAARRQREYSSGPQAVTRRRLLQALAVAGPLGFLTTSPVRSLGQDRPPRRASLLNEETRRSILSGLNFLASQQTEDGAFGSNGYSRNVGVCGLAGLAFMAHGSTPGRGRFGLHVRRCIEYLVRHTEQTENARQQAFIIADEADSHGPMYGHGFATLFLAEVYGMTPQMEVREKLTMAVNLIINAQNDEGGWRYFPQSRDADLSVTVCQVMALRAARNAGIFVPNETIDRCVDYVKRCQNPDGGFMYMLSQPGVSRFPRSAAGVVALYNAGIYEGDEIERGLRYLLGHVPVAEAFSRESHYFYGHYYAAQAMWQAGGDYWQRWYPAIRDALVTRQKEDGSWFDSICSEYGTAMACLVLQMPNNYLPIFQR